MLLKFAVFILFFFETTVIRAFQLTSLLHKLRSRTVDRFLETPPRHSGDVEVLARARREVGWTGPCL